MAEQCDSCGAPIWWAVKWGDPEPGERPKRTPIDHATVGDPKGNVATWRDQHGVLRFRYLKKDQEPEAGHRRAISHYATCPQAGQWRGKRRGDPDAPARAGLP